LRSLGGDAPAKFSILCCKQHGEGEIQCCPRPNPRVRIRAYLARARALTCRNDTQAQEPLALKLVERNRERFTFHPTKWGKFPDGTDNIEMGGMYPQNKVRGENILFLASFHNNDVTLSQFHVSLSSRAAPRRPPLPPNLAPPPQRAVPSARRLLPALSGAARRQVLNMLAEAFIESLTILLPYYPTGTMERVTKEGQVRCMQQPAGLVRTGRLVAT